MLGWVVYIYVLCIPPPSNVALVITYQKKKKKKSGIGNFLIHCNFAAGSFGFLCLWVLK